MYKISPKFLMPIAAVIALCACTSPTTDGSTRKDVLIIGGDDASLRTEDYYQMPTPNELFRIVRAFADEGQRSMMSPAQNVSRYASAGKKALNFGVYATDLVYASSYGIASEVARYYLNCKKLGDELGLAGSFSTQEFSRLERNLVKGDSLDVISNEAYERAYRQMQQEDMGPVLTLVLVGGWVESMHLVSRAVLSFDPANPMVQRIAEQKVSLDHLVEMTAQYPDNPEVAKVRGELIKLRDIYDTFPVTRTEPKPSPSGRQVLGDDITVFVDAEGFAKMTGTLESIRENIIMPEDLDNKANS